MIIDCRIPSKNKSSRSNRIMLPLAAELLTIRSHVLVIQRPTRSLKLKLMMKKIAS